MAFYVQTEATSSGRPPSITPPTPTQSPLPPSYLNSVTVLRHLRACAHASCVGVPSNSLR